jgi:hypothetical protein
MDSLIAVLAGSVTVFVPLAICACLKAHLDILARDEWQ